MTIDSPLKKSISRLKFYSLLIIAIAAWLTYGNVEDLFSFFTFLGVGLLAGIPWIIPFAGIPFGIMDVSGVLGERMYDITRTWVGLPDSWLPIAWYVIVILISILVQLFLTVIIISRIKDFLYGLKNPKTLSNIALINCNIIDGNLDSEIIEDGVILINNVREEDADGKQEWTPGLIKGKGRAGDIAIPSDYEKVDLQGQYVLPGLINAHCHLEMDGKPTKAMGALGGSDFLMDIGRMVLASRLGKWTFTRISKRNMLTALNAGVTTLRIAGSAGYTDFKLKRDIETGRVLGPRLLIAGKALSITGGHGAFMGHIVDSKKDVRRAIRANLRQDVDLIKIISTGGVMSARAIGESGRPQMTVEEIETACFEAHRGNRLVATHCQSPKGIEEALNGGVDSIDHGADIPDDLVPLFKNNPKALRGYTALIPTIGASMGLTSLPRNITKISRMSYENAKLIAKGQIKGLRKAYKEGIKLAVGTDSGVPYSSHYDLWKELVYFCHYTGMTPKEAIYMATKNTADVIGIGDITGSIEEGKSADLQVVAGNPHENLDVLGNVKKVVIRGQLIRKPVYKKIKALEETPVTKYFQP